MNLRADLFTLTLCSEDDCVRVDVPYDLMGEFAELNIGCRKTDWMRYEDRLFELFANDVFILPASRTGMKIQVESERMVADRLARFYIFPNDTFSKRCPPAKEKRAAPLIHL